MKNIELVIKIPEEIRLTLINNIQLSLDQQSICNSCIEQAIINGTLLPKGHGDLIDRKELLKQPMDLANYPSNYVHVAPTIIEADKECEVEVVDGDTQND